MNPQVPPAAQDVAPVLLAWSAEHGRHDLPWQRDPTPYRVWVSEVMLQQTQVATVIPYFERFVARLPDIASLAAGSLDEVLSLWTGLGYYARARNLHRAAKIVMERHGGSLPEDIAALQKLPGIGRSTAGAVLALASGRRHPILDSNARRVLSRYFGVEGDPLTTAVRRRLWSLAEACTPFEGVALYTQAIMDLGSDVCTHARPRCEACPLAPGCVAHVTGRERVLPSPRRKRPRATRSAFALVAVTHDGALLLQRRPDKGVWGGLWSLPLFASEAEARAWREVNLPGSEPAHRPLLSQRHTFTHYDLTLELVPVHVPGGVVVPPEHRWYDAGCSESIGLSKAVTRLDLSLRGAQARERRSDVAISAPRPGAP